MQILNSFPFVYGLLIGMSAGAASAQVAAVEPTIPNNTLMTLERTDWRICARPRGTSRVLI